MNPELIAEFDTQHQPAKTLKEEDPRLNEFLNGELEGVFYVGHACILARIH